MAVDRWFRFYEEAIADDKVLALPNDMLRWQWVVLLAVNSKYGGEIPSLKIAAINLRMSESKAAQVIAALAKAELLDRVDGGYFRAHNWTKRQPVDATAAERKRRQRQKERDGRDGHAVTTVTVTPTELRDKIKEDDEDDARARRPLISAEANKLADECAKIAGHDLAFIPPSWCGAAYRAQMWINQGWPEDLILESVKAQAVKKRDGPAKSIQYFEPGIASAIAKAQAPVPNVIEIPAKTVEVTSGSNQNKSGLAAIDRIFDRPEMRSAFGQAADETAVLGLPDRSVQRS